MHWSWMKWIKAARTETENEELNTWQETVLERENYKQ